MASRRPFAIVLSSGYLCAVMFAGCGSPTAPATSAPVVVPPSPAPVVQLVATPVYPATGASIEGYSPLSLKAANATPISSDPVLITFQIATNEAFTTGMFTETALQAAGAETSIPFNTQNGSTKDTRTYYWRVRAGEGEQLGPFSETRHFLLTPRPPTGRPDYSTVFSDPPILVSPARGSTRALAGSVTIRHPRHSDGPTRYVAEASEDPTFAHGIVKSQTCSEYFGADRTTCHLTLPRTGHYYWRAQAFTAHSSASSFDYAVASGYSETWEFDVVAERILAPEVVGPPSNAMEHPRPTFTVRNARVDNRIGQLAYRFNVRSKSDEGSLVATALVPEGADTTSWTPPFDLMVGARYYWSAQGIDVQHQVEVDRGGAYVTLVPRASRVLTLAIDPPAGAPCGGRVVLYAAAPEAFDGPSFSLTTVGTIGINLSRSPGGPLTGTIGGETLNWKVFAPGTSTDPAPTVVTSASADTMTGTFDARYMWDPNGLFKTCNTTTGFRWTVSAR